MRPTSCASESRALGMLLVGVMFAACSQLRSSEPPAPAPESPRPRRGAARSAAAPQSGPNVVVLDSASADKGITAHAKKLARRGDSSTPRSEAGYYMDVQEAQLRASVRDSGAMVVRDADAIVLRMSADSVFEPGGTHVRRGADGMMTRLAGVLGEFAATQVVVTCRADDPRLSKGRAIAISQRLLEKGVRADRLVAVVGGGAPAGGGTVEIGLELIVADGP